MYNNSGAKIKGLASTLQVIGIVFSCVIGFVIFAVGIGEGGFFVGLLYAAIGCFVSWLSFLLLAGFGELVDNSAKIVVLLSGGKLPEEVDLNAYREPQVDTSEFSGVDVTPAEVNFVMQTQGLPHGDAYVVAKKLKKASQNTDNFVGRRCPNCGTPARDDNRFCQSCGTRL